MSEVHLCFAGPREDVQQLIVELSLLLDQPDKLAEHGGTLATLFELVRDLDDSREYVVAALPDATSGIDAQLADGTESLAPAWELESFCFGGAESVSAWDEGVAFDGDLTDADNGRVDRLERDALAVLAAIRQHRKFAGRKAERSTVTTKTTAGGVL